jgi:hypothetical protein
MRSLSFVVVFAALAIGGCGGQPSSTGMSQDDFQTLRFASGMYETYISEHKGKTPPDEQTYRSFIATKQDVLGRMQRTADQLLTSPRNGEPLTFVYGRKLPQGPDGVAYIAYEKTSVDGKRGVLAARGLFEEIDEAQFKKIFPGAI